MSADMTIIYATILIPVGVVALYFWRADRREARERRVGVQFQEVDIRVNGGLHPDRIVLREGRPIRLRFTRTNDGESWWDDVEFPYGRMRRELQEGETATLDIQPLASGEYAFFGGLGTMRGALVIEPTREEETPEGR